jgi:hypothetical protein
MVKLDFSPLVDSFKKFHHEFGDLGVLFVIMLTLTVLIYGALGLYTLCKFTSF